MKVLSKVLYASPGATGQPAAIQLHSDDDPQQAHPLNDPDIEQTMIKHLERLMEENDAPAEQCQRLGLA